MGFTAPESPKGDAILALAKSLLHKGKQDGSPSGGSRVTIAYLVPLNNGTGLHHKYCYHVEAHTKGPIVAVQSALYAGSEHVSVFSTRVCADIADAEHCLKLAAHSAAFYKGKVWVYGLTNPKEFEYVD